MRIENPLLALYKGYGVFQSREDFSDSLGALELAYRRCSGMILDNSTYHCGALELSYRRCRVRKIFFHARARRSVRAGNFVRARSSVRTRSERETPSERDADAADYEAGHSDAEFNEAAYPLAAGLDADCSCLK